MFQSVYAGPVASQQNSLPYSCISISKGKVKLHKDALMGDVEKPPSDSTGEKLIFVWMSGLAWPLSWPPTSTPSLGQRPTTSCSACSCGAGRSGGPLYPSTWPRQLTGRPKSRRWCCGGQFWKHMDKCTVHPFNAWKNIGSPIYELDSVSIQFSVTWTWYRLKKWYEQFDLLILPI